MVKLAEPPMPMAIMNRTRDQRGHGIHSGEVEQQGDSIPDTEHDHGLLGADSVVNDANQPEPTTPPRARMVMTFIAAC